MNSDFGKSKEWEVSSSQIRKAHGFAADADHHRAFEQAKETGELAKEILNLSRSTLLINLRFMEAAFIRMIPAAQMETMEIATDGQFLYYDPVYVCRQFIKGKEIPVRDYLHVILHCLFRHLFVSKKVRCDVWDLACDIAVENMITGMNIRSLRCEREVDQEWLIRDIKEEIPKMTAEWIYSYLIKKDMDEEEVRHLRTRFYADDHTIWHNADILESGNGDTSENGEDSAETESKQEGEIEIESDMTSDEDNSHDDESEDGDNSEINPENMEMKDGEGSGGGKDDGEADNDTPALTPEEIKEAWKEIAERIEVDMDTSSDTWGEGSGNMQQALKEINRDKYDYSGLLRRFTVMGENVEINDEEFDYIFYTYGMDLTGNMPFVEPLEYKDVKRIREFVIALDTSESVSGEIVQKFVEKTWNILKQSENFFTRVNVHIIQCGARVEEDVKITTQEEFDEYIKHMVLKGFGGTDFRPVFEYVDTMVRTKEFTNFKGLLYFTDGYGTFPVSPPDYDAAFVFLDQGYDLPEVPPWVIKMIMTEDEVLDA